MGALRERSQQTTQRALRVEISAKTMVLAALTVGASFVALRLAPVALALVVALFLVGTLNPLIEWLHARKLKRGLAIALVFGTFVVAVGALVVLTLPAIVAQVGSLVGQEPAIRARLVDFLSHSRLTRPLADSLRTIDYGELAKSSVDTALAASTRSAEVVAYLVSSVFLALYIIIDRERLRGGMYALVPRNHHVRLSRVILNLEKIVGGYIRGQLLTSALMTGFTLVLLLCCGVEGAFPVAVIAGVADVLPYVGVFISVGVALAAASSHGFVVIIIVVVAMLAYEELESRFLVPRIYGNVLKLPSSIVLFSLLTGGALLGIVGALLALPVAAALRMLIEELRVELPGEAAEDGGVRESDAREEREYQRRVERMPAIDAAAVAVSIAERHVEEDNAATADRAREP